MTEPGGPGLSRDNPWPGLVSFSEEDREYFHGRDAEAADLLRLVRREQLAVLFGRSGLGKTSLLNAGLFPLLRHESYLPVHIRLGFDSALPLQRQVLDALGRACEAGAIEAPAPDEGECLWAYFHRAGAGFWNARNRPVVPVLVFDQFEEAFTVGQRTPESRQRSAAFLAELGELIENRMPEAVRSAIEADAEAADRYEADRRGPKVVLSFREDFLAAMEGLKRQMPSLMRNRYRLQAMDGAQAYDVVTKSGGHLVTEDVARRIVGLAWRNSADPPPDPAEYPGMEVDPALLSVICSELNGRRRRARGESISPDLLKGADREILSDFYERSFEGLDPRVRVFVENELITDRGYRDSFVLEDAVALPGLSQQAIDQLVDRRLLRVDDRLGLRRVELTHDVLTRVVRESRDSRKAREAEAAARAREAAARLQQRRNRIGGWLAALGLVAAVAAWIWVSALLRDQEASKAAAEEQRRLAQTAKEAAENAGADARRAIEMALRQRDAAENMEIEAAAAKLDAENAQAKAADAIGKADRLTEEAKATALIVNARNIRNDFLDRALLLGAGAIRQYPQRLDAQVDLLGRLLANPQLRVLLRDRSYAFSGDGRMLAAGSSDGGITIRSTESWRIRNDWRGHSGHVVALALSPDATRLISAGADAVTVWRVPEGGNGQRLQDLKVPDVQEIVFSPDGSSAALRTRGGTVRWWRIAAPGSEPQTVFERRSSRDRASCHAFTADGRTLIVAGPARVVRCDIAEVPRCEEQPLKNGQEVLGESPDCRFRALGQEDGKGGYEIRVQELSGEKVQPRRSLKVKPALVQFGPDGRTLAIVDVRDGVRVWDSGTSEEPRRVKDVAAAKVQRVAFSPDGKILAVTLEGGIVIARDWKEDIHKLSARVPRRLRMQVETRLLFSSDGRILVAYPVDGGEGGLAAAWTLERGDVLVEAGGAPHRSDEVEFNRGGETLVSARGTTAYFWDPASYAARGGIEDFRRTEFSPDGTKVAVLLQDGAVEVRNASGETVLNRIPAAPKRSEVTSLAFSWERDSQTLAMGLEDGSIAIYNLGTNPPRLIHSGKQHEAGQTQVVFSPDRKTLASAGNEGRVVLWNAPDWKIRHQFSGRDAHAKPVLRLAFSPDGRFLASGSEDKTVALLDVAGKRFVARFEPHDEAVDILVFIEDGRALVSGKARGWPEVWDVSARRWLTSFRNPGAGSGSVAVSPQGRHIALLHEDGLVTLRDWDRDTLVQNACQIANRNLACAEWRQFMGDRPYRRICESLPEPSERCP